MGGEEAFISIIVSMYSFIPSNIEAVIVGNGEFPAAPSVVRVLEQAPFVVCCDGAADTYDEKMGRLPDAVVGDGDSLSSTLRARLGDRFFHVTEQEHNDQTKAVRFLIERGIQRILIVGATGKREDHTIGNIGLLVEYLRMGVEVALLTDYGVFTPAQGDSVWESFAGQQVSVFNFGCTELSSEGLAYSLYPLASWWQGTLNESLGNAFRLSGNGCYLVYRTAAEITHRPKK